MTWIFIKQIARYSKKPALTIRSLSKVMRTLRYEYGSIQNQKKPRSAFSFRQECAK